MPDAVGDLWTPTSSLTRLGWDVHIDHGSLLGKEVKENDGDTNEKSNLIFQDSHDPCKIDLYKIWLDKKSPLENILIKQKDGSSYYSKMWNPD